MFYIIQRDNKRITGFIEDDDGYAICFEDIKEAQKVVDESVWPGRLQIIEIDNPTDAKWISERLNLASILEEMAYRFATGKTDGTEIIKYVFDKLEKV